MFNHPYRVLRRGYEPFSYTSGHYSRCRGSKRHLEQEVGVHRSHVESFRRYEPGSEPKERVRAPVRPVAQAVAESPVGDATLVQKRINFICT